MSNGPTTRTVAAIPTGGKSYSEMLSDQLDLINRQRQFNLRSRLRQEESNRKFRTQQLENIYDFDVSGLAIGHADILGALQSKLSDSLNPDSEDAYTDAQQLTSDIAYINNVYNVMNRWAKFGKEGREGYTNLLTGETGLGDEFIFDGTEESLRQLNDNWDRGAFQWDGVIGGSAGNRSILGFSVGRDGTVGDDKVNFFDNIAFGRPEQWYRPEIREAALFSGYDYYVEAAPNKQGFTQKETESWMGGQFDRNENVRRKAIRSYIQNEDLDISLDAVMQGDHPEVVQQARQRSIEEALEANLALQPEPVTTGTGGTATERARAASRKEFVDTYENVSSVLTPGFNSNVRDIQGGDAIDIVNEEGQVISINPRSLYVDQDGKYVLQFAQSTAGPTGDVGTVMDLGDAPRNLVSLELSGSNLQAVDKYIQRQFGGVTLNDLKYTGVLGNLETPPDSPVDETPVSNKLLELDMAEGPSAPEDTIGNFKLAIADMAKGNNPISLGLGLLDTRDQKLAKEIQNEPLSVQIERINQEIALIEEELKNTPSFKRTSVGSKFQRNQAALERLKALKNQLPSVDGESKNRRIEIVQSQIADLQRQLAENESLPSTAGTRKSRIRRTLNEQIALLEQELENLTSVSKNEQNLASIPSLNREEGRPL